MSRKRKIINPFYVALVVCGIVFFVTACVFGVMTVRGLYPEEAVAVAPAHARILAWMDNYGFTLLMIELGALAVSTIGVIGTDGFRTRLAERHGQERN